MTSRYRVEYALKSHRRDQFIEWVKGLLISPFVLVSQPAGYFEEIDAVFDTNSAEVRRRYAEIMRDIEAMIDEHRRLQQGDSPLGTAASTDTSTVPRTGAGDRPRPSRLQLLVPTVGPFFTHLPLEAAFLYQDMRRHISSRRLVAPSFNDVRLTLNTAQMMALTGHPGHVGRTSDTQARLELVTFDGDLTLYDDGHNLEPDSPLIPRILALLRHGIKVGIVTAAGYDVADQYYARLHGLLDAVHAATDLTDAQKHNLLVVGGEASFVFAYSATAVSAVSQTKTLLAAVDPALWMPDAMKRWPASDVAELLDLAEMTLRACIERLQLPAQILRKARAVGMIPLRRTSTTTTSSKSTKPDELVQMARESLEEVVLSVQRRLEVSAAGRAGRVPFCAFNGGRDVFVDIGDKSWGVLICQHALLFLGKTSASRAAVLQAMETTTDMTIATASMEPVLSKGVIPGETVAGGSKSVTVPIAQPQTTLHVGDQFLSAGANDFRARRAATTAWVSNPLETEELLDELLVLLGKHTGGV